MTVVSDDTAHELRAWLQAHRLTQKALGRLVDVNYRTTRRWCAGRQPIPPALWERLGRVTPDEIEDAR